MANIRPKDLPAAPSVSGTDVFILDTGSEVLKATPAQIVDAAIPLASQAEAEAGSDNTRRMTPLRTKQAITVNIAELAETTGAEQIGADDAGAAGSVTYTTVQEYIETLQDNAGGGFLVGVSDGSSGSLYTTLQGFVNYLKSSAGSSIVNFINAGTGVVSRLVQAKLRDTVSPEDYGALSFEEGRTDGTGNAVAFVAALETGRIVDGNGRTYVLDGPITPSAMKVIRNCKFQWADTTLMATQQYMLDVVDVDHVIIENNEFNLGTVENCGSADDSSRGALKITSSDENVAFIKRPIVRGNRVTGDGNGTGIYVRSAISPKVYGNTVENRQAGASPDPANDCMNGIDVSYCTQPKVYANTVTNHQVRLSGNLTYRFSRGIVAVGDRYGSWWGNTINLVDQGVDFSGGVVSGSTDTTGNVGNSVFGNTITDVVTWGIKHANAFRDGVTYGNVILRFGAGGITYSGHSSAPTDADFNTQNNRCFGNIIDDATNNYSTSQRAGVSVIQQPASTGYPRGIEVYDNTILDTSGGGYLLYGVYDDVTYDGSSGQLNLQRKNTIRGAATAAVSGFRSYRTSITGSSSQSLTSGAATDITWDTEIEDGPNGHSTSTETDRIYARVSGRYRVTFSAVFAATSAGYRQIRVLKDGGSVAGGDFTIPAASGANTTVAGSLVLSLTSGQNVRLEATQNSGGNLNLNRANSLFTVELIELA